MILIILLFFLLIYANRPETSAYVAFVSDWKRNNLRMKISGIQVEQRFDDSMSSLSSSKN